MASNYLKILDVWEGQLEVNETELKKGGIKGLIIRLNDMNGGHHIDTGFAKQWKEAGDAGLLRAPYFVYNPWVTGLQNYEWLVINSPKETRTICIDIEVRRTGYDPQTYASQFASFISKCQSHFSKVVIYTGQWFLDQLSYWPTTCEYWWARYLNVLYPSTRETWSWEKLDGVLNGVVWNPGPSPARTTLHQCSGDRIILPGTIRAVDINIFNGTEAQLYQWFGAIDVPVVEPLTLESLDARLRAIESIVRLGI